MRKLREQVIIYTDGGSRGNPGPSAGSFILTDPAGIRLQAKGIFIGHTTCNVAEYTGLVKALESAKQMGAKQVSVFSDSLLLVNQINSQWKVKSENLEDLFRRAMKLLKTFEEWEVVHVRRYNNADADALVNLALDREKDVN